MDDGQTRPSILALFSGVCISGRALYAQSGKKVPPPPDGGGGRGGLLFFDLQLESKYPRCAFVLPLFSFSFFFFYIYWGVIIIYIFSFSLSVCVSLCCSRSFSLSHSCRVLGITLSLCIWLSALNLILFFLSTPQSISYSRFRTRVACTHVYFFVSILFILVSESLSEFGAVSLCSCVILKVAYWCSIYYTSW